CRGDGDLDSSEPGRQAADVHQRQSGGTPGSEDQPSPHDHDVELFGRSDCPLQGVTHPQDLCSYPSVKSLRSPTSPAHVGAGSQGGAHVARLVMVRGPQSSSSTTRNVMTHWRLSVPACALILARYCLPGSTPSRVASTTATNRSSEPGASDICTGQVSPLTGSPDRSSSVASAVTSCGGIGVPGSRTLCRPRSSMTQDEADGTRRTRSEERRVGKEGKYRESP